MSEMSSSRGGGTTHYFRQCVGLCHLQKQVQALELGWIIISVAKCV